MKVKAGQRVVRGRNWKYNNDDGGEGNIGTVTQVNQDTVKVQWDSQNLSFEYRMGKDRKFDLRLYDNLQTGNNFISLIFFSREYNNTPVSRYSPLTTLFKVGG